MKKFFLCFFYLLFPATCLPVVGVKEADNIRNRFIKDLQSIYSFKIDTTGGSYYDGVVNILTGITINDSVALETARNTYISLTKKFINMVNENKTIRPYLYNYPFEINNLAITLSYTNSDKEESKTIAYVFMSNNEVHYCTNRNKKLEEVFVETYEEAVSKAKESQSL